MCGVAKMNLSKFSEMFDKKKTFRPKKKFQPGTMKYSLHKQAQASLNSGINLRQVSSTSEEKISISKCRSSSSIGKFRSANFDQPDPSANSDQQSSIIKVRSAVSKFRSAIDSVLLRRPRPKGLHLRPSRATAARTDAAKHHPQVLQ